MDSQRTLRTIQRLTCMTDRIMHSLLKRQFSQSFNQLANTNLFLCNSHHSSHIQTIPENINKFINLMLRPMTSLISKMRNGNGYTILKMFAYLVLCYTIRKLQMMRRIMVKSLILVAQSMNTMMNKMLLILSSIGHRCTLLPAGM